MTQTDNRSLPLSKMFDLPPLWLVLFVALAWVQATFLPLAAFDVPIVDLAAGVMVGAGLLLMALAIMEMRRARTTIIPHLEPQSLVTSGVFNRSRNPIYLGDVLILSGLILFWKAWPSVVLIPLFVWVITDRFIQTEEAKLRSLFGAQYETWASHVRRWI